MLSHTLPRVTLLAEDCFRISWDKIIRSQAWRSMPFGPIWPAQHEIFPTRHSCCNLMCVHHWTRRRSAGARRRPL